MSILASCTRLYFITILEDRKQWRDRSFGSRPLIADWRLGCKPSLFATAMAPKMTLAQLQSFTFAPQNGKGNGKGQEKGQNGPRLPPRAPEGSRAYFWSEEDRTSHMAFTGNAFKSFNQTLKSAAPTLFEDRDCKQSAHSVQSSIHKSVQRVQHHQPSLQCSPCAFSEQWIVHAKIPVASVDYVHSQMRRTRPCRTSGEHAGAADHFG